MIDVSEKRFDEQEQEIATLRELKQAWHDKFWEQSKETDLLRKQLAAANTLIRTYREESDQLRVNRDDGSTDWRGENEV